MRNILLTIILIFVGCTPYAAYTAFLPVDSEQWEATDSAKFEIKIPIDSVPHTLSIYVRTTEAHSYDALYLPLEITQIWEHSDSSSKDTLCITLCDDTGKKKGKGINYRNVKAELCLLAPIDTLKGHIYIRPCVAHPVHGFSHVGVEIH